MKVLVRAIKQGHESYNGYFNSNPDDFGDYPVFGRTTFHTVDLEERKVDYDVLPSLLYCTFKESMVALGKDIFLVGGDNFDRSLRESFEPPDVDKHLFYRGCSKTNLISHLEEEEERNWDELPRPSGWPVAVSLLGKMYSFGITSLQPEVYDPSLGGWKQLPQVPDELFDAVINDPVLPDPSNKRIIVNVVHGPNLKGPSLFAFYPGEDGDGDGGGAKWECLATPFGKWDEVMLVVEDVIYFHKYEYNYLMHAYDLRTSKWLNVVWTNKSVRSLIKQTAHTMFCRGDGYLCLANCVIPYCFEDQITFLYFLKFGAERCPNGTDALFLTARRVQEFQLKNTCDVLDFLPLHN